MNTILKEPERKPAHQWETRRSLRNVGGSERTLRVAVGLAAVIGATVVGTSGLQVVLGIAGTAALLTGISGFCPGNRLAGRDSFHRGHE
ncbi:MAG: DUF2892 domain-containing protein [Elusimicrobia bacterium]|nr:DUF2892 domain-containing protein [Elusimicrobiota bacterium]